MSDIDAVLDTNVFVAAHLGSSTCLTILTALRQQRFLLITSPELRHEILTVLQRPRFAAHVTPAMLRRLQRLLTRQALTVHPTQHITACRDPRDNCVLECALAGAVDCIVTGDADLRVLHPFRGLPIIPPDEFVRHWLS